MYKGVKRICVFSGNWRKTIQGDPDKLDLFSHKGV